MCAGNVPPTTPLAASKASKLVIPCCSPPSTTLSAASGLALINPNASLKKLLIYVGNQAPCNPPG